MTRSNSISVIIPTYRREAPLRACLSDLFVQEIQADIIIVVDQTPEHEPATNDLLRAHANEILWIRHPTPNLPGARNIGLAHCKTDIVIFLDDDARVGPRFVGNHLKNYNDPAIMAVAGPVLETPDSWVDTLPAYAEHPFTSLFTSCWQYKQRRRVQHAPGGNMSIRTSLIPSAGGFDDAYQGPAFREETDFFLRVAKGGHQVVYDPECWILHKNGPKVGGCWDDAWRRQMELRAFNEAYFAIKNFAPRHWPYFIWVALRGSVLSSSARHSPTQIPRRLACTLSGWRRALSVAPRKPVVI